MVEDDDATLVVTTGSPILVAGTATAVATLAATDEDTAGKRREIPIRAALAWLLAMHIGNRRAGPLFLSRQKGRSGARTFSRQRICQMVQGCRTAIRQDDHASL